jgi:hypothetical protein
MTEMQDLEKALADISQIRSQIARGTEFQGYGPATLAATGLLAAAAAAAQALWLQDPASAIPAYLALWVTVAAAAAMMVGAEACGRTRRVHGGLADEMIQSAIEQFLPAAMAGALVTLTVLRFAPASLWMLPGLWQIVFSLGVFASCRFLPRPMLAVGLWYMLAGIACLALAQGEWSFSPWAMGLPYGLGQLLMAAVIHRGSGGSDG